MAPCDSSRHKRLCLLWPLLPSRSASQHLLPWAALPAGAAVASLHEEERAVLPAVAAQVRAKLLSHFFLVPAFVFTSASMWRGLEENGKKGGDLLQLEQQDAELLVVTSPPASSTPYSFFKGCSIVVGSLLSFLVVACAARLLVRALWSDSLCS